MKQADGFQIGDYGLPIGPNGKASSVSGMIFPEQGHNLKSKIANLEWRCLEHLINKKP